MCFSDRSFAQQWSDQRPLADDPVEVSRFPAANAVGGGEVGAAVGLVEHGQLRSGEVVLAEQCLRGSGARLALGVGDRVAVVNGEKLVRVGLKPCDPGMVNPPVEPEPPVPRTDSVSSSLDDELGDPVSAFVIGDVKEGIGLRRHAVHVLLSELPSVAVISDK